MPTYNELFKQFIKKYPGMKAVDYRPFSKFYVPFDRAGIVVWLDNGDVVVYLPEVEKEKSDAKEKA